MNNNELEPVSPSTLPLEKGKDFHRDAPLDAQIDALQQQRLATRRHAFASLLGLGSTLGLAACGGGGDASSAPPLSMSPPPPPPLLPPPPPPPPLLPPPPPLSPPPPLPPPPPPPVSVLSQSQAARLLTQATFGVTPTSLTEATSLSASAWVEAQFAAPRIDKHFDYVTRQGLKGCSPCNSLHINAVMESFWLQAVTAPDQLRQRMAFALSQIFVVSTVNSAVETSQFAHGAYYDMLNDNAFSNFRVLLEAVSLHPTMGFYLSHFRNEKEDVAIGRIPDENFAREVMQLFSIGLWQLNEDGSRRKDSAGADIPTYGQTEIAGMARVFTGWSWGASNDSDESWSGSLVNGKAETPWDKSMRSYPKYASVSEKRIISNIVIPANTGPVETMKTALDALFNHPNVGPFIGRQLIKRLVTSNPTPAYVARVSRAFANNGAGVRGDMKAVIRAILLDPEARDDSFLTSQTSGKLREPVVRLANWMRAFGLKSASGSFPIWNLEDPVFSLGQNPFRAPSVFNWYRPEYAPPGILADQGLTAPEFQITHETTITGYANFIADVINYGGIGEPSIGQLTTTYAPEVALAGNPTALIDRLSILLTCGQLTSQTRTLITNSIISVVGTDKAASELKVRIAITLMMMSPDYLVQR